MFKRVHRLRLPGWLLAISGSASLLGALGTMIGSALVSKGTLIGGLVFWLALFPLTFDFLRGVDE